MGSKHTLKSGPDFMGGGAFNNEGKYIFGEGRDEGT